MTFLEFQYVLGLENYSAVWKVSGQYKTEKLKREKPKSMRCIFLPF